MTPAEVAEVARFYRPAVVRWAESYVAPAEVEDLVQSAFKLLVEKAPDVDASFAAAWLRATVWRLAREHRPERRLQLVEQVPEVVSPAPSPEDTLQSVQIDERQLRAIELLADSKRDILRRVANGETLAEVARADGIPESTVRKRADAAVSEVRAVLQRESAAERRRTGGFSSWAFVLALLDLLRRGREVWRQGVRAAIRPAAAALGAISLGGVLLTFGSSTRLAPTPDELPARVVEVAPLPVEVNEARAERGADAAPEPVPAPPPTGARRTHDIGARMLRERLAHPQ